MPDKTRMISGQCETVFSNQFSVFLIYPSSLILLEHHSSFYNKGADYISNGRSAQFGQCLWKGIENLDCNSWIVKIGCADLNGSRAGYEEFHDVIDGRDAADAHDGNSNRLGDLIHHTQGNGFDGRTA